MAEQNQRAQDLRRQVDANRVEFLRTDLSVCFTMIRVAETESRIGSNQAAERSLRDAEKGYRSLQRLLNDPKHAQHMRDEDLRQLTAELERLGQELERVRPRL